MYGKLINIIVNDKTVWNNIINSDYIFFFFCGFLATNVFMSKVNHQSKKNFFITENSSLIDGIILKQSMCKKN